MIYNGNGKHLVAKPAHENAPIDRVGRIKPHG